MTWYITDKAEYQANLGEIGVVWGEVLGKVFPAMAVIEIKGLLEERAKIEIEATAVVPD
jgi:enamine deaminase RidA (YjgF/YER057c/UK114 family)